MKLIDDMLAGDHAALSRLISLAERDDPRIPEVLEQVYPHLGKAYYIGLTGPPGAGKSTLVDKLVYLARQKGFTVGVLAIDPTSPLTGGAVLGDRIRMQQHYLDEGVFVRSMATRKAKGGLPPAARTALKLLDASGKDLVFIETVGVGQTEVDIMEATDTTIVVLVPEAGDKIQTMKAGLLEIADIFALNKADRPGADALILELESLVRDRADASRRIPVVATQAVHDVGLEEPFNQTMAHRESMTSTGHLRERRREQRAKELGRVVEGTVFSRLWKIILEDEDLQRWLQLVERGEIDPSSASREILENRKLIYEWIRRLDDQNQHRGQPPPQPTST